MKLILLLLGFLVSITAHAEDFYWKRNDGVIVANPVADCQAHPLYYAHSVDNGVAVRCFRNGYALISSYNRFGSGCTNGSYNPETFQCEGAPSCLDSNPVSSSQQASTACYNQCSYESLGAIRDFNNALAPIRYEYVPTYQNCTGDEAIDISDASTEYGETNDDNLSCRNDGFYQVCISADQSCKIINGVEVCIDNQTREDEYNCGTFNGEVVCFPKTESSQCKKVNGESLCVYPEGDKVDPDSTDHPSNGGNANRNNSDDILDQQDLTDNTPEAQAVKDIVNDAQIRQQANKQAEEDNPSSSISGIECDKSVSCSGDAIQCAIARMQKKQLCMSEFNESEVQKIIDNNQNMSPLGSLAGESLDIDVEDFLDTEEYVTTDNQCPEPLAFTVMGAEYQIILTPLCDLAGYISWFVLFATWFSMAVILAKSLGSG